MKRPPITSRQTPTTSDDPEPTWPGMLTIVAAAVLNWMMPETLTAGPGWIPVAVIALLTVLAMLRRQWHDQLGYAKA